MEARNKGPNLRCFSLYWIFHFGFHLVAAIVALAGGVFVIFSEEAILPGLALCSAAIFAFVNGINGFRDLIYTKSGSFLRNN